MAGSQRDQDIFGREHEFEAHARSVLENLPEDLKTLSAEYALLFENYTKLLRQSDKLTRLADNTQNKLMRLKNSLEQKNARIQLQQEELIAINRKLEEASLTDTLTGLRNRRFLENFLEKDVENVLRAHMNGPPKEPRNLFFMLLDIDHFKEVNDSHGHQAGDHVLREFSELLQDQSRKGDLVVRWGGEEFLLVSRDVDRPFGYSLAERLRNTVENHRFKVGRKRLSLTCSIGFSFFPFFPDHPAALAWSEVIHMADQGLYAAKRAGRNAWLGYVANGGDPMGLPHPREEQFLNHIRESGWLDVATPPPEPLAIWE